MEGYAAEDLHHPGARTRHEGAVGRALAAVLLAAVAAAPSGLAQPAPSPPAGELLEIPYPDMEGLEEAVEEQLNDAHRDLRSWLRQEDAPAGELAATFGRLGQLLHAYSLTEAAAAAYTNASRLAPEDVRWLYYLARLAQEGGRHEEAALGYRRFLATRGDDVAARVHLGEVLLAQNRGGEAEEEIGRAVSLDPENPAARAILGEIALSRQDYRAAIEHLRFALARVPAADRLYYPLAMAYRGLGEMETAREHLKKSGSVGVKVEDPLLATLEELATGERVHLLRGRQAFAAGQYEAAAEEFKKALAADPRSVRARVNLGSALGQTGDVVAAMAEYRKAIETSPANFAAHLNLGMLLAHQGWDEDAAEHLARAIAVRYDDAEAHLELARVLRRTGQPEAALEHFREAGAFDTMNDAAPLAEAALLVEMERFRDAAEVLGKALERIPHAGRLAYALARILAAAPDPETRDPERALGLAQRLFQTEPLAEYALLAARSLAELEHCAEAAEWQEALVRAAEEAGKTAEAAELRRDLERYAAGPPCRLAPVGQ